MNKTVHPIYNITNAAEILGIHWSDIHRAFQSNEYYYVEITINNLKRLVKISLVELIQAMKDRRQRNSLSISISPSPQEFIYLAHNNNNNSNYAVYYDGINYHCTCEDFSKINDCELDKVLPCKHCLAVENFVNNQHTLVKTISCHE